MSLVSRKYHLRNPKDFKQIYDVRKVVYSENFRINFDFPVGLIVPQFAIVISKKVSNKATQRNLLRRRIFHILHDSEIFQLKRPVRLIVSALPNPKVLGANFAELQTEVIELLAKIRLPETKRTEPS